MIRILMLNNEFPPLGGGTATVNLMLLREFAEMPDVAIDLLTGTASLVYEESCFAERIRIQRVPLGQQNPHHARQRDLLNYAGKAFRLAMRQRDRQYDFAFAWSGVPAGTVAVALRHVARLPYLVRIGGSDIPGYEHRYRFVYPILSPIIRHTWRHAQPVVVKCRREADLVRRIDSKPTIAIIPNGVDTTAFSPDTAPHEGPLRLTIVARLIEHKGHRLLFQAVKALRDEGLTVQLTVAGDGDSYAAYVALVNELRLQATVRFLGSVDRKVIPDVYRQADVFVLPSAGEGMSVSTLEAMAAGLAIVVTRTGGTDELLEEGINGFGFEAGDVRTLTALLRQLCVDRDLVRRMGAASRRKAEGFTWAAAAQQYRVLFEKLKSDQ